MFVVAVVLAVLVVVGTSGRDDDAAAVVLDLDVRALLLGERPGGVTMPRW